MGDQLETEFASPSPGRIIDRPIKRGDFSNFSSRLGTPKRLSPRLNRKVSPSGSSVKDIVNWLETTSNETPSRAGTPNGTRSPTPCGRDLVNGNRRRRSARSSSSTAGARPLRSRKAETAVRATARRVHLPPSSSQKRLVKSPRRGQPSSSKAAQPSTSPEEYSLTLLKYKSYFNNRPLARCLDNQLEDTGAQQKGTTKAHDRPECTRSSSAQQLDMLLHELSNFSSPFAVVEEPPPPLPVFTTPETESQARRDPDETNIFWDDVRSYLHITDDELTADELPELSLDDPSIVPFPSIQLASPHDLNNDPSIDPSLLPAPLRTPPKPPTTTTPIHTNKSSYSSSYYSSAAKITPTTPCRRRDNPTAVLHHHHHHHHQQQAQHHQPSPSVLRARSRAHNASMQSASTASSTSLSGSAGGVPPLLRRMTTGEKMSEIDEFLSSPEGDSSNGKDVVESRSGGDEVGEREGTDDTDDDDDEDDEDDDEHWEGNGQRASNRSYFRDLRMEIDQMLERISPGT